MAVLNVEDKIHQFENFINNVLKEDLRVLDIRLQQVNSEISDLIQQKHTLKVITNKELHPNGFKTQVNLGCNFFMEAAVKDTSTMLFNIGLNHYLELTYEQAVKHLDTRIKAYKDKATELRNKSIETRAHVKLVLFGISELQNSKAGKTS